MHRILPIIPNETYLDIFEHIAPSTVNLTAEQLKIFINLSGVCRFFAHFCLPRIFECVEFSGSQSCSNTAHRHDTVYKAPRERVFGQQIAAKQPLALALAETVRECRFIHWRLDHDKDLAWAVRLFAHKHIAAMAHMKHIRRLAFSDSFIESEHWKVISALESLQDLMFNGCQFLQGPADAEPDKRIKLKVPRLEVTGHCTGNHQPLAAVDAQHLRTLAVDFAVWDVDWFSHSAITELHVVPDLSEYTGVDLHCRDMPVMIKQMPRSIETLRLNIGVGPKNIKTVTRKVFGSPGWNDLPLLQSLVLQASCLAIDIPHVSSHLLRVSREIF